MVLEQSVGALRCMGYGVTRETERERGAGGQEPEEDTLIPGKALDLWCRPTQMLLCLYGHIGHKMKRSSCSIDPLLLFLVTSCMQCGSTRQDGQYVSHGGEEWFNSGLRQWRWWKV